MSYKILLADDSVTVQKIITLTFFDEGVDVLTANNGTEAISRLQYMRPALVMADVSLPGKNGYEICEFVKTHPEMKNTPVILLVPAFETFDEERARRIGADFHLVKPFQSIRTLITTVKNMIEQKDAPKPAPLPATLNEAEDELAEDGLAGDELAGDKLNAISAVRAINGKSAKIEELLRQAVAVTDSGQPLEEEPLLQVDLSKTGMSQVELLTLVEIDDDLLPIETLQTPAIENSLNSNFDQASAPEADSGLLSDLSKNANDDVLELEDILPELPASAKFQAANASAAAGLSPPDADASQSSNRQIPQSVIDEIVNRVVAQVSEKLFDNLSGKLAEAAGQTDLAHRIAPEVAEILATQKLSPYPATENLLEID